MEKSQLLQTLKNYFGYEEFRPLQQEIIISIFEGQDNLVIMPTGGGKSICYQLPALLLPGLTLVISPLIALMKDQVDGLRANGVSAAFLNSSQEEGQQEKIFKAIDQKKLKLLYVAPESLQVVDRVLTPDIISLIAVDEAHCISSWGHDFRPAYTQLGYLKKRFSATPVLALTATADKATRQDICDQLNIPHAAQHIASFDRKNLSLDVRPGIKRFEQIEKFISQRRTESGIIYCLSRKNTEALAAKLSSKGYNAQAYHAGLGHEKRIRIQDDFINDTTQIICATIAFGMGIDKSNIHWVIHYNMPKNLEGYYQEIGRAGRDGLPSDTLLFHSYADVVQLQKFAMDAGNHQVQLAKLERMKQYAEALTCRRKILLSYFGEITQEDCGNCDICKNPPQFFDGTLLAQKALSCLYRLKGKEPMGTVIDVLRGAENETVTSKAYHQIKTYGAGKDISWHHWQNYLIQLINLGYVEIAFHQHNHLQLNPEAKQVLFEGQKVQLAKIPARKTTPKNPSPATGNSENNSLFERLRKLRLTIAREEEIAAYLIFNDASLKEMEKKRPISDEEFLEISGVGRQKLQDYGYRFIKEIIAFSKEKRTKKPSKGQTFTRTLELYQEGLSMEEIARERELSLITIQNHLAKLYARGEAIAMEQFVSADELQAVRKAKKALKDPNALKPYYEHFEGALDYWSIRCALAVIEKKEETAAFTGK